MSHLQKIHKVQELSYKIRQLEIKRNKLINSIPDKQVKSELKAYVRSY
jgi:hypothetical protein